MISINKRNIALCIVFSIFTSGIYLIYWEYLLVRNVRQIKKDGSSCLGEMLCLMFVPFYSLYWWFTRGKIVKDEFASHGYSASGNEIAYLILNLFGLGIVSMAIMQSDFNSLLSESVDDYDQLNQLGSKEKDSARASDIKDEIKALKAKKEDCRKQQKVEMDKHAQFNRAAKPYLDAKKLLTDEENYTHYEDIYAKYEASKTNVELAKQQRREQLEREQAEKEERIAKLKAEKKAAKRK